MANLPTMTDPLPFEQSYQRVITDLQRWSKKIRGQLDRMYDEVLLDMEQTLREVNAFISLIKHLLIEQDNQLAKARSQEEMDCIEGRIEQLLIEIEVLQSLAFTMNTRSVKFNADLRINCHGKDIKSICHSLQASHTLPSPSKENNSSHYRFLLSQTDALLLQSKALPDLRLNSSRYESVLTFESSDLRAFLNAFDSYWKLFPTQQELRLLLPEHHVPFIVGQLRHLQVQFQFDDIKVFADPCPKSDERILLIEGKSRRFVRDGLKEIYGSLAKQSQKSSTRLYEPMNLSSKDMDEVQASRSEYGGFIPASSQSTSSKHSRTKLTDEKSSSEEEEEEEEEDDLDLNNDDWWNYPLIREKSAEPTERTMMINSNQAGVIIGMNASRIDQIKQKTGAYVFINGETADHKRAVIMKGTPEQVDRAYTCIENLIRKHKDDRLLLRRQHLSSKRKQK